MSIPRHLHRLPSLLGGLAMVALLFTLVPTSGAAAGATCAGTRATIVGTPGDDVIVGKRASDVIQGGGGNDTIIGGAGADDGAVGAGADR